MRPSDEAHEWAQTGGGERSREEEPRHVGFEVVIEKWSSSNHFDFFAQGRTEVREASQVETKSRGGNDMIRTLGDLGRGCTQAELDSLAGCGGFDYPVAEKHRHLAFDSLF